MIRIKTFRLLGILGLFAGLAATPMARADQLQVHLVDLGAGATVTITRNNDGLPNPITGQVFAGQFHMQLINGGSRSPVFNSYCVDLNHFVSVGQSYRVNPRSTADGLAHGGQVAFLYTTFGLGALTNVNAAALQLAIWKELVDGGGRLDSGNFQATASADILRQAQVYLTDAANHSGNALWLDGTPNGSGEDRGQNVLAVPEPASVVLLGLGSIGMMVPFLVCRFRSVLIWTGA